MGYLNVGKGSKRRPMQVSNEEYNLRYAIAHEKIQMSDEDFKQKIEEIRSRTGKP